MADSDEDSARMRAALALARRGLGITWPNPTVGCVIARDGLVLGRGATRRGGRPHAEQVALEDARARYGPEAIQGATAWVTLEPCAHHGRTPPCADALIAAGIARVVSTVEDPDPRVRGRGFNALREAGVALTTGVLTAEARSVNAGFLKRMETGRPWVTLKLAATLDGRIATLSGESRWITGAQARARTHLLRAQCDAVLIGAATARADDPQLDVRLSGLEDRHPIRIVADGSLSLSLMSRLVRTARETPLWLLRRANASRERRAALEDIGVETIEVADRDGELELGDAMDRLGARGLSRVLCEGGGRIAAALMRDDLVDELVWFSAGAALGADAAPAVARLCLERLADAPRFDLVGSERVGDDVLSVWRRGVTTG